MRVVTLGLLMLAAPALATPAEDMAACTTRHAELTTQAATYQGDAQFKRLIDADLKRALREQVEGDGDECLEALDHAAKLLANRN